MLTIVLSCQRQTEEGTKKRLVLVQVTRKQSCQSLHRW